MVTSSKMPGDGEFCKLAMYAINMYFRIGKVTFGGIHMVRLLILAPPLGLISKGLGPHSCSPRNA